MPTHPAETIDQVTLLRRLLMEEGLVPAAITTDQDAIHLTLNDPSEVARIIVVAEGAGWVSTRQRNAMVSIEPRLTSAYPVGPGSPLYHVADRDDRPSILANGLLPGTGGNTTYNRSYPPRVHLCIRLGGALALARHQTIAQADWQQLSETECPKHVGKIDGPRDLAKVDLYEIAAPAGTSFHRDSHFAEGGIWTEVPIANEALRLMDRDEWEPTFHILYPPPPPLEVSIRHMLIPPVKPASA